MARRTSNWWSVLVFLGVAAAAACGGSGAAEVANGEASASASSSGSASGGGMLNLGGTDGSGANGSTGSGASSGSGSTPGSGSTSSDGGSGASSSGGADGSGASGAVGSGASGATTSGGSDGSGSATPTGGSTIDVGTGGAGNTIDTGAGGSLDTGAGGSLDLGSGGSLDLGSGGSLDLGSGGTIDTCIPTCVPDILGSGEDAVNLVVFGDATASGCDTEGRMWVGGNADLSGYGVGNVLSECDPDDPVLVVGGDLTITGGVNGLVWVGGEYSGTNPKCGGVSNAQPPPVDFPDLQNTLTAYSQLMAGYPVNGTAAYEGNVLVLSGDDPELNVIEIDGADLTAAGSIRIDAPVTSTVIVNVTGTSAGFIGGTMTLPDDIVCGGGVLALDDFCNQLVWNMPDVTSLSVGGTAVQGSVLAPKATLTANGSGQINGAVIVAEYDLTDCIEMHPHYFNGCLCTEEVDSPYACCP